MSDEADRRRAYRELEERGQPVPGKYFGTRMPPMKQKQTPKIKVIDTTKMKQLKLLKKGGEASPLKDVAKVIQQVQGGKTGIKTVDMQKKKDAAITKNLKRMAKTSRVSAKPQTFDITPKPGSALSIQKRTITMAKDGGLMEAIEKVKAKGMKDGGDVAKPKMRPKSLKADKTVIINEDFSKRVAKANEEAMKKAKKMAKGGMIKTRARPSPMRAMSKLDNAVEEFIETIEPFQGTVKKGETLRNMDGKTMVVRRTPNPNFGNMISDRDRAMVGAMLGEGGRMISDADRRMVSQMMGARRMEDGGVVPAKFKGFSKLPEDVQQKMNPTLAKKFNKGGAVKMGKGGGVCKGMGAARASGKFKLR